MAIEEFSRLIKNITSMVGGDVLDNSLADKLNREVPPNSKLFMQVKASCLVGIKQGWMCQKQHGGIKFGRVIRDLEGFSVDVVCMEDVIGPHHRHPRGEIDMIMPISKKATFDDTGEGWLVYEPNSSHKPTVSNGNAIILYLLPGGEIEF